MKRRLPPFIVDINHAGSILDDVAQTIDTHGAEFGIQSVTLLVPAMQSISRLKPAETFGSRKVRLFTHKDGHFHGTHHNLKNDLTHAGQLGMLVFSIGDGAEQRSHFMAVRPSAAYQWSARPVRPLPAVDQSGAIHSAAELLDTLDTWFGKPQTPLRAMPTLKDLIYKHAIPNDLGELLEKLSGPLRPKPDDAADGLACNPA